MAKPTKKQQRHALKKRKQRAAKRQRVRRQTAIEPEMIFPRSSSAEQQLRSSIQRFAHQKTFATDFETALGLYFGEEAVRTRIISMDEPETADFQEWYYGDYVLAGGSRLIDLFAEQKGPSLPPEQRQMLHDWIRTNRLRLLEIQEITPGVGEVVKDLLSGEILRCFDISMSYAARKWSILLARPLLTNGRWHFTGSGGMFSPLHKELLVSLVRNLWQNYQAQHPSASLDEFYRDNSLQLRRLGHDVRKSSQNPVYVTLENHHLLQAAAEYEVLNQDQVLDCLDEAEEFVLAGESEDAPYEFHYVWLLRGRSRIPEVPAPPELALQIRSEWTAGPGEPSYRSLGDVTVTDSTLELSCLSRERLAAGRSLLDALLPGAIIHRGDLFSEVETKGDAAPDAPLAPRLTEIDPAARQVEKEMLARQAEQWLETPIPSLDNRTPRNAAQTAEGRAQLEEVLKILEYLEEENPALRGTPYSAQALRRELALT